MSQINAMALALAVCGGTATFMFMQFGGPLSLWAAFVAWASFFHSGGKMEHAVPTIACALWGCLLGGATMYIITGTSGAAAIGLPAWAGIVVFVSAAIAVLSGQIPVLATVPITMHALACIAAFVVLKGAGGPMLLSASIAENAILNVGISMVIGVGCGIATAKMAGSLMASESPAT